MMLFGEHQLGRALAYSQAVLEHELESHYNTWIINSASSQLGIVQAALYREKRQKRITLGIILLLSILSLTILAFGYKTFRQARQIRETNAEIRLMNRRLEEAGKIKEGYVFRYIMLSSKYLRMIEDYRHSLRVTLKEEGVDALKKKLRQTEIENFRHPCQCPPAGRCTLPGKGRERTADRSPHPRGHQARHHRQRQDRRVPRLRDEFRLYPPQPPPPRRRLSGRGLRAPRLRGLTGPISDRGRTARPGTPSWPSNRRKGL